MKKIRRLTCVLLNWICEIYIYIYIAIKKIMEKTIYFELGKLHIHICDLYVLDWMVCIKCYKLYFLENYYGYYNKIYLDIIII